MLRMRAGRGRIAWRVGNGAFVTGTCRFVNKARFRSGIGIVFQQNGHFCCPHCDKVVAFGFLPRAASSASRCLKGRGKTAVPQYSILFAYVPFQIPDDFTGPVFLPAGCFLRKEGEGRSQCRRVEFRSFSQRDTCAGPGGASFFPAGEGVV